MTTTIADPLERIAGLIHDRQYEEARTAIDAADQTEETRCELLFLEGCLLESCYDLESGYDKDGARDKFQEALELDADHSAALFHAALLEDQAGNEDDAIELYERCTHLKPAHVNALLNLAVLYEERNDFVSAEAFLQDVLAEHPNHRRAAHFLKSVRSSCTMLYAERRLEERERQTAMLDMAISDFELSVRSRNCLRQMNIRSLSDLLNTSEPELLSYKNFGETSLNEIKAMLSQKGLRLGQALQPAEPVAIHPPEELSGDTTAHLDRPVAQLELSVRAQKALQRLGVMTLGELIQKTEAELLTIKNFGQTSMVEIKKQLTKYGLSFRTQGS